MTHIELKLRTKFLEIIHSYLDQLRVLLQEVTKEIESSSDSGERRRLETRKNELENMLMIGEGKFNAVYHEKTVHLITNRRRSSV